MLNHKAELLFDTRSVLGEGPVWDWRRQQLFCVDIEGKKLHRFKSITQKHTDWNLNTMVGAAVPGASGNLILAAESGLIKFDVETGESTALGVLQNSDSEMRYNDGKVGPDGNFWIGSMHKEAKPDTGNLYCVDHRLKTHVKIPNTTISNGMAWSSDSKTFYFIDTPTRSVFAYDFNLETSSISHKRVIIDVPKDHGSPDGMCIDSEGMLWIAHWGGNCVRRWHPATGEVLAQIEVDAPHVTSCCFGGEALDTLYITSARSGLSQSELQKFPASGGLFVYRPGVKGTPIHYFKDQ
ncbi:MAG: SMP-30/gluconolactonase/LRE family protein [Pricia sp.]